MPKASERAVSVAKEVLAKIMAYDPYFANPSESMVRAWAEHISLRNADRDDMLEAVARFYESNTTGQKPLPANISSTARSIRVERRQHETEEMKADREARIDAKVEGHQFAGHREIGEGARKLSRAEWEAETGEKFPATIPIGKPIPADRPVHPAPGGSGHSCDIPGRIPRGENVFWTCDECSQRWMATDVPNFNSERWERKWMMCEQAREQFL